MINIRSEILHSWAVEDKRNDDTFIPAAQVDPPASDIVSSVVEALGDAFEDIVDSVKAVAEVLEEKVEGFLDDLKKDDTKDA